MKRVRSFSGGCVISETWYVCIDDTCDEQRKKFVCAGSLIGRVDSWKKFNKKWRKALNEPPAIAYFHGKERRNLTGQFAQFRDQSIYPPPTGREAANAKKDKMRKLLEESELIAFGIGVNVPDFDRVRATHPRAGTFFSKDPFEFVLQQLIHEVTKVVRDRVPDGKVSFMTDMSSRSSVYRKVYTEFRKWNPKTAKAVLELEHGDDHDHYGLQAADMAASAVHTIFYSNAETGTIPIEYPLSSNFWRVAEIDEKHLLTVLAHQSVRDCEL